MKPVCVKCSRFLTVKRNGVAFEEMREIEQSPDHRFITTGDARSVLVATDGSVWAPYKLWLADLLACPSCGVEILVRAEGQKPVAEHYMKDYDEVRATLKPSVRVEG